VASETQYKRIEAYPGVSERGERKSMENKAKQLGFMKKSESYHEVALYPMVVLIVLALIGQGRPGAANGLMVDALLALGWFGWCHLQAFRAWSQARRPSEKDE
jgi:hypothetical protein